MERYSEKYIDYFDGRIENENYLKVIYMRFAKYLKSNVGKIPRAAIEAFLSEYSRKSDERSLMSSFSDQILKHICNNAEVLSKRQSQYNFFGHHSSPDDLQVIYEDRKVLLECKVLIEGRLCEVRNAFTQLLEYLLDGKWHEGYVLIFDKRHEEELSNLFGEDPVGKLNRWFVSKFTLNGFPFQCSGDFSKITLSAIRIYKRNQEVGVELCKSLKA